MATLNRIKIGQGFFQKGYGRGYNKKANIYLIDGLAYAKSKHNWKTDFYKLQWELEGYVRINISKTDGTIYFHQVSGGTVEPHIKVSEKEIDMLLDYMKVNKSTTIITEEREPLLIAVVGKKGEGKLKIQPQQKEVTITIKELTLNGDTAIRIMKCLKEHDHEVWSVLKQEIENNPPKF